MSDHVRLGAVARWVTPELAAEALDDCGVRDKKPGALPAGFMVYFTLALALFQQDSYDDVAEHMVGGVPGLGECIPNKSSFTRARQRLGVQAIEGVFRKLTGPLAPAGLEGSFYRGMRLAAVDGFVLDAPETEANRRRLGGPKDARGKVAGFPQVRVVTLTETGTHGHLDAAVDGVCCGEPELAIRLAPSAAGMLVIMDRGFPGVALWRAYTGAGAHLLIRARSCVAARPVEYLPDGTYLEVFLPCHGPAVQPHPQRSGQDYHPAPSITSVTQATALGDQAAVPPKDGAGRDQPVHPQPSRSGSRWAGASR